MDSGSFFDGKHEDNLQEQRDEVFALQSIFNTEEDERLKLLSEVSEEKNGLFSLLITVYPKPAEETIHVNVAVPTNDEDDEDEVEGAAAMPLPGTVSSPPKLSSNVQLSRSLSGQRWQGSFEIKYLSPLHLLATFPPSYPSCSAPSFHLSCDWLTSPQLSSLEQMLQNLWLEACNMPVVFTWVDWLENDCLNHLAITDQLMLRPHLSLPPEGRQEVADVTSWEQDLGATIAAMIRYNQEKLDEEFCQTTHLCEVCYDELPGTQFFRMGVCPHAFCHACVQAFCQLHVTAGTVEELRCPIPKCDSIVPPHIIQTVLPGEAYERWEKLLLQKTLDSMEDTVYCPRCGSVVIAEEDKELYLGHCTVCLFAFCTRCERGWHQGNDCETEEELLETMEKKNNSSLNAAIRKKMDDLRRKLEEEMKTKSLKAKSTKPCPHCKIPVEKTGGCNKMSCKCGAFFCWVCGKEISGYSHFQTSAKCSLFPGAAPVMHQPVVRAVPDAVLRMQAMLAVNPALANNQTRCPTCKQENLKGMDRNNHIKCWNCKSNFCFLCRQRIVGLVRDHFIGPCDQHS